MKRAVILFMVLAASAVSANADVSTQTNVSATTTSGEKSSAFSLDRFYVGYFGNLEGSQLNQFGSPYQVDANGKMTRRPMTFASCLTTAYMVSPDVGVGAYTEMNVTPVLGPDAQMLYVGVTTFDQKLVSYRGLTVFANAIVEAPTTSYDINRGMVAAFETTPYIRYSVPHSRFTLGAWTEVKNYAGSRSGKLLKTYYEPYVSYRVSRPLAANLGYELEYDHFVGKSGFTVYETDLQPGVLWFVSRNVLINPYFQFFTNNPINMNTAAFGASVVARLL